MIGLLDCNAASGRHAAMKIISPLSMLGPGLDLFDRRNECLPLRHNLLLRRDLSLRRFGNLLLLSNYLLRLRHMGALVRDIPTERLGQLLPVAGEDLGVMRSARDGDVGHGLLSRSFAPRSVSMWMSSRSAVCPWLAWLVTA